MQRKDKEKAGAHDADAAQGARQDDGAVMKLARTLVVTAHESWPAFLLVFKITFPIMLGLRVVEEFFPLIATVGSLIHPLMEIVGLPGETALPWAAAIIVQPYAGYALLIEQWEELSLTVAQATIFGILVLEVHAIAVEARIAHLLGARTWFTCVMRFGAAFAMGFALNWIYSTAGWLQQPADVLLFELAGGDDSWAGWLLGQAKTWLLFAAILYGLNLFMKAMRAFHIEKVFVWLLAPFMRLMGIHRSASLVGVIGLVLGLTFGAALLMAESRSGRVSRRDIFLSVSLLGICHSVLEDTLLTMLFGAHVSGVLFARVAFAILIMAILSRLLAFLPDKALERWIMTKPGLAPAKTATG